MSTALAATLAAWLTDWGKAVFSNDDGGPAIATVVDVKTPEEAHAYVLATPVTSAADRITLESGTASQADVLALMARHGSAVVGDLEATIVLEGRRTSLRIVDIRPRIRTVKAAPAAAFLPFPSSGAVGTISVTADLDREVPVLESSGRPYFDTHQIDLSRGERESLFVSFQARRGYQEFDLVITYVTGGKQYEQTVPGPTNGVFRVAAPATDYRAYDTVYDALSDHQFVPAGKSRLCEHFPKSRGC